MTNTTSLWTFPHISWCSFVHRYRPNICLYRFTDGDFQNLKLLKLDRPPRMIKQKTYSGPTLDTEGRDQRRQSVGSLRRALSEVQRGVKTIESLHRVTPDDISIDLSSYSRVGSRNKLKESYIESPSPTIKSYRTEVAAEVHRDPSSGSGSSKGDMSISSMVRTASPPKVLGMNSNGTTCTRHGQEPQGKSRSARHSQSLEMVSPTDKLSVKHDQRRVKSYDGDLLDRHDSDYDRLEITQFNRGPFYNTDYDVVCEGRSPELRSKVRYNDTGSFEEINDEDVQLLDELETMDDSDDTETLNGAQKYRELWNLRATFEEEEDFSDTIRMEDMTSPEDQSPEQDPVITSVTTSFESNTDPEHQHLAHHSKVSTAETSVQPGSANLLHPNYETRRETYRSILSKRLKRIEAPTSTDNSFDSVETLDTDGDVSDTSRPEQTTTSFESTTDNTDSTGERETHRLQQMRGDSGYKSLETQQTLPLQGSAQPVKKQIQFAIEPEQESRYCIGLPEPCAVDPGSWKEGTGAPCTVGPGNGESTKLSIRVPSPVTTSPRRSGSHFDRKSARTASKKRREYSRERQAGHVHESVGGEVETDSRSDHLSGDSFDESHKSGKVSVFTRFFKSQCHKKGPVLRDYSIDEKTNAIFHEFVRHDPYLDRSQSLGVVSTVSRPAHPYTRHRSLHRKHTEPSTDPSERRRNKLTPDMRSVSLGSDSSTSSVRRLSPQDSIEEEDYDQLSPGIREHAHFQKLWADAKGHSSHTHVDTHTHQRHRQTEAVSAGQNTIHEIPIIKLPEDESTDA